MRRRISLGLAMVLCLIMVFPFASAATTPTPTPTRPVATPTPTPIIDYLHVRIEFQLVPDELMPESVVANYLRDGAIVNGKTLNKSNNWESSMVMEAGHSWQVKIEDVPGLTAEYFPKNGVPTASGYVTVRLSPKVEIPTELAAKGVTTKLNFIKPDESSSITLHLDYGGPIAGAKFKLYQVATMSKDLTFTMKSPFSSVVTDPSKFLDAEKEWLEKTADELRKIAESSKLTPDGTETTDVNGNVTFLKVGEKPLTPGIYLAFGYPQKIGNYIYSFKTSIITVPYLKDGMWEYHQSADIKRERTPVEDETYIMFEKIWEKDDNSTLRPTSIDLLVLLDGKQMERITLNASNGWKTSRFYSGTGKWSVQEVTVPNGYLPTYNVKAQDNTCDVTVVNSYQYTTPTPVPTKGNIPQTGMIWWPVILMAVAGAALFALGLVIYARGRKHGKS